MRSVTPHPRRSLGLVVVVPVMLAACAVAGATPSASTQQPATASPIATPTAAASPTPAASAAVVESPAATASGGPIDYAAWVERQGFGGSSGLNEVRKDAHWLQDNPTLATRFDIQTWVGLVDHLAAWLDENPPTGCWADYHAMVRAGLGRMHDGYATAKQARDAGDLVPTDVVAELVSDAEAAYGMAKPPGC